MCPRLVITSGEPAGIGPDLCIQLAKHKQQCELLIIADPELLQQRADSLGIKITLEQADLAQKPQVVPKHVIRYLPVDLSVKSQAGILDSRNANYVLRILQMALDGCLSKQFDAMVTAPVHKAIINEAQHVFTGHTEFLAEGAGVDKVVMMLATSSLRVALVTTHLPLIEVSPAITQQSLTQVIQIIQQSFATQFGLEHAHIAVCGLNPHAGEGGHLGREEIDVIIPVIERLKQQGLNVSGPWPADTVFVREKLQDVDVVLAMYHDQGLPVLKHQGFGQAVNVTLGLPFIRTSVDHGTALDLVGTGKATTTSLQAAIDMAVDMIKRR
ncbi:MAG: 4-hydroxythreonine-4-phosphate dehydrogenase PdxA [Piscirickettsiaceae bacterium]|nr:4-hydroxythreonine-4-phosphate dehydrogenase PdxA [Piscirickettsiaceae bacterium]